MKRTHIFTVFLVLLVAGCNEDKSGSASNYNVSPQSSKAVAEVYQRSRPFDEARGVNRYDAQAPAIEIAREAGVPMPSVDQATLNGLYQIEAMGVSVGGGCNKGTVTKGNEVRLSIQQHDLSAKRYSGKVKGYERWNSEVLFAAAKHQLDPHLIHGVISQESGYVEKILGPDTKYGKAKGLMQLIDSTGKMMGVSNPQDLLTGAININAGSRYLKSLLVKFNGNASLAVGGYNAGPGNITKCGNRISPYANGQTLDYVEKVLGYANAYKTNPNPSATAANTTQKSKVGRN